MWFTHDNWSTPQTVTITAVNDSIDQPADLSGTVTFTDYGRVLNSATLSVTVDDDDNPKILVSGQSSVTIDEGSSQSVKVSLDQQPTSDVTVSVAAASSIKNLVSFSASNLTFTSSNWSTQQTVTISATDNSTYQATNPTGSVTFSDAANGYDSKVIQVTVEDDESPTLTATVGTDDSVDLSLANGPSSWWYKVNTGSCTSASATSVTDVTGTVSGSNTATAYSDSACSTQIATKSFTITPPSIVVSGQTSLTIDEGNTQNVGVKLSKQPAANVTVAIAVASSLKNAATVSASSLTFTTNNWSTQQTVTITAADDSVDQSSDPSGSVTFSYSHLGTTISKAITVTIKDDDTTTVVIAGSKSLTIDEGSSQTVQVSLDRRPPWPNNIITGRPSNSLYIGSTKMVTVSPMNLTFTQDNWSQQQTVTITAVNDSVDQPSDLTGSVTFSDDGLHIDSASVSITVDDDDNPNILVSGQSSLTIDEGNTQNVSVSLDEQPTSDVTVSVSAANSIKNLVSFSASSLTFTSSNWSTQQTVTITAVDDTISHATDPTGSVTFSDAADGYDGKTLQVTIDDDDNPKILVSGPSSLTIDEGSKPGRQGLAERTAVLGRDRLSFGWQAHRERGDHQPQQPDFHVKQLVHSADGDHHRHRQLYVPGD